jgi:EAL domain-containing protein (putative c-di-GMP-specific phosphodiesterase class I)
MLRDRTDLAVVEMINHLGHVTGMKTVAEFVESAEILVALRGIGVDYAQGYHVAMPQPFLADPVVEEEQRLTA